jgi:hypothetical protein
MPQPSPETIRFIEQQIEINKENNEAHTEIKEMLVEMKTTMQGIHAQTIKTNGWINKHAEEDKEFKIDYMPTLKAVVEERKDTKFSVRRIFWESVRVFAVGVVTYLLVIIGLKK